MRAHTAGGQTLLPSQTAIIILYPCRRPTSSLSPSCHLTPILLAVKLSPLRPAAILHPCCQPTSPLPNQQSWRSNSLLSTQRSSSTPAGGQPHPSPPSGHLPPILLVVKLSPLNPAVILHPSCWWSNCPLPTLRSSSHPSCWRSNSPLPSPPAVMAVKLSLLRPAVVLLLLLLVS